MDLKPGFDDAGHPWVKLELVSGQVIYGKMADVKNDFTLLDQLKAHAAFDLWWPIRAQRIDYSKYSYTIVAGKHSEHGDFYKVPCIMMIRSSVVFCGTVTGKHVDKILDKVKKEKYDGKGDL